MIYLDNAATTKVKDEVIESMMPYFKEDFSNPSSLYSFSNRSRDVIRIARSIIAKSINSNPSEIYFTSGGSESDNWALKGIAYANKNKGNHIITTKIEHHAILDACKFLEDNGFEITYLDVDEYGVIDLNELESAIRPTTILISTMFANNEIGTIQPIKEIGDIANKHNILFHTDAVQAYCNVPIDVHETNIDLMSVSGHKVGSPKGIGFLYIKNCVKISPLIHGGKQEKGLRGGTENVPYIVGLGKAVELSSKDINNKIKHKTELRDYFMNTIETKIPNIKLNGARNNRLCNNINFSVCGVEGESLLIMLDMNGVCVSSGSACTSGSLKPSHVLSAIGISDDMAHSSIRMTIGNDTTKEDIDYTIKTLVDTVKRLRNFK